MGSIFEGPTAAHLLQLSHIIYTQPIPSQCIRSIIYIENSPDLMGGESQSVVSPSVRPHHHTSKGPPNGSSAAQSKEQPKYTVCMSHISRISYRYSHILSSLLIGGSIFPLLALFTHLLPDSQSPPQSLTHHSLLIPSFSREHCIVTVSHKNGTEPPTKDHRLDR